MHLKHTSLIYAAALLLSLNANAQKLPTEQKNGVYAPDNIRTDGKDTEWAGSFQAYNRATQVYYTMANDKDNLYLAIQVGADPRFDVTSKILSRGITLMIKSKTKGQKTQPLSLTFPLIEPSKKSGIMRMIRNKKANQDSLLALINAGFAENSKEVGISGFKQISDSTISVYNEHGIKAASGVDAKRVWLYELQLPLKYIKPLMDAGSSFDYKVIVNGSIMPPLAPGEVMVVGGSASHPVNSGSNDAIFDAFSPTDFSATYNWVKK